MKKALMILIPLLLIGAAAAWWFLGQPRGEKPGLADALSAEHTVLVAGAQNLDLAVAETLKTFASLPPEQLAALGPAAEFIKSADARKGLAGFDPADKAGWAEIGIDPTAGAAVVIDARVFAGGEPLPIFVFKESDRAKLVAFAEKTSGNKATITDGSPGTIMQGDRLIAYIGTRDGYTAMLGGRPKKLEQAKEGFAKFLAGPGGLAGDKAFARALNGAKDLRIFMYAGGTGGKALVDSLVTAKVIGDKEKADALFFLDRFIGLGSWVGQNSSAARLVASEAGAALIGKLFVPSKKPPQFSAYVPNEGWSALRVSVNLAELFSGIADALPPSAEQQKSGIAMAPVAVAMMAGFSYDDLKAAFPGHAVIAADPTSFLAVPTQGPGAAKALVLVAVGDGAKADSLIPQVLALGKKAMPDLATEAVDLDGAKGHAVTFQGVKMVAVRADDVLIVGTEAEAKAAIARKKSGDGLKFAAGKESLDDAGVVYGIHYDLKGIAALVEGMAPGSGAMLKASGDKPIAGAMRADKHGVFIESKDMGLVQAAGMAAGLAVPAFQQYIERAKGMEREMMEHTKAREEAFKALGDDAIPTPVELAPPPGDDDAEEAPAP